MGKARLHGQVELMGSAISAGLCYSTSEPQIPCLGNGGLMSDCRKD